MATNPNMEAIETVEVGAGGAASISFTSIPQTYTDLYIVTSIRFDQSSDNGLYFQFNSDTGTNYSRRYLYGDGSSATSGSASTQVRGMGGIGARSSQTASTFGNSSCYIPNYTGSNGKSVSVDGVNENNATTADAMLWASLWNSSSAITSISLFPSSGNIVQHSTATLYGVTSAGYGAKATGGIITSDANYFYHTFLSSGTFTPTSNITADYLVVAGGGGGGYSRGAGGGAGGLLNYSSQSLSIGTTYTVTVGGGGSAGTSAQGGDGSNSQFDSLTASVGGGGGAGAPSINGRNGGSGGGAVPGGFVGAKTVGQGNDGGIAGASSGAYLTGGGGGATEAGQTAGTITDVSGKGGDGSSAYSSWGSATSTGENVSGTYWYAGGGGGGRNNVGTGAAGGKGGGGNGGGTSNQVGFPGDANTGGGGGGGANGTMGVNGGAGGSGIVIVRYAR